MLIALLIQVCVLVAVVYVVLWVLGQLLPIPDKLVMIIWIIVALVVLSWFLPLTGVHIRGVT